MFSDASEAGVEMVMYMRAQGRSGLACGGVRGVRAQGGRGAGGGGRQCPGPRALLARVASSAAILVPRPCCDCDM